MAILDSITLTVKPRPRQTPLEFLIFQKYQENIPPAADYLAGNRNIPPIPPRAPTVARG